MDMDQRTRFIGGRAGRIILLGDGTEILASHAADDDGDVDMEDRGEAEELEDDDLDEQVQNDASNDGTNGEQDRSKREETPAPSSQVRDSEAKENAETSEPSSEDKAAAASDSTETKTAAENKETK